MTELILDKINGYIVIKTDDPSIQPQLESRQKNYEYIHYLKKWGFVDKVFKLYENRKPYKDGIYTFKVRRGWASYLVTILDKKALASQLEMLKTEVILSPSYRTVPFENLRDYQNEDMLYLMKYRVGLCQVQTGYGKTSCIATLANYYHKLGKNVLLVAPSSKARDELVKRCKNVFGLDVTDNDKDLNGNLDCIITSGLMISGKVKDPVRKLDFLDLLSRYQVLLADEVEYTINPGGEFLYKGCNNLEVCYGFSGTADKQAGSTISFRGGLDEVVVRNKDLVKYFGPSLIYRMPVNRNVDNIMVRTSSLDLLKLPDFSESKNIYSDVMNCIWTDPNVCNAVVRVARAFPMTFIPINNLASIINHWIECYFKNRFRVLLICGEGYIYYDIDGNRTSLTLDEVCDYAKRGLIDVIPSTSAGYRALDIPGLENILLIQGKVAGVVLQSIGRVARMPHMNIITLIPKRHSVKIPVYTNGMEDRQSQLKEYYKYCNLRDIEIDEEIL